MTSKTEPPRRIVDDGDYITVAAAPNVTECWQGQRGQVVRWEKGVNHYYVRVDLPQSSCPHTILLSPEEMLITEDEPIVESMRSPEEIRAMIDVMKDSTPPLGKEEIVFALQWVLKEREDI